MRLSGLASGLEIDSMVKELMKAKRTSYDNMIKKRTKVEWQQQDYRAMSAKIVDFRNNKLLNYNLSNAMNAKTSEVSGDTSALTVNSTDPTAAGTLTVQVDKVATAGTNVYTFGSNKSDGLVDLGFKVKDADNVSVTINGKELVVSKTAKLSDLAALINNNSGATKTTALYNEATGQLSISATQTGAGKLVIDDTDIIANATSAVIKDGDKAEVSINGISYEQDSNRFVINGVDFTAKSKSTTSTTIATVKDTTKTIETIKSFITEYNSLIASIGSELSEEKNRNYDALTSDEKKAMTDNEIEIWEAKARSGTLRNDGTLSQLLSELRSAATDLVGGVKDSTGKSIMSIGITTGSYTEKGKLVLDENMLRSALETYPDETTKIFTTQGTGVFTKMIDSSMNTLKTLSTKAGTSTTSSESTGSFLESSLISSQLRDMKTREGLLLARLTSMETQYFKQFTAMETAINKFNSQASSFSSLSGS